MKSFILILFLLGIIQLLPAQEIDTMKRESTDSTFVSAQPRGCVDVFENQTVSSSMVVMGCSILNIQNVTVSNTGNLILSAPQEVIINDIFEVQLGGVLSINEEQVQFKFHYDYDAAGNRITRRFSTTSSVNVVKD